MKNTRVSFSNDDGLELAALLTLPVEGKPLAYAIFAHCFACTKSFSSAVNIAQALTRRRIAVLRFDFTGVGESEGDFARTTFSSQVSDLISAARFLEQHHESPRLLIGHSMGGAAALHAAGRIPSVMGVATIAAPFDPGHFATHFSEVRESIETRGEATVEVAGRRLTVGRELFDDLARQNPREVIQNLDAALLVMHSPRDLVVGISHAADIYQAARHPKSFISLDPADHLLSKKSDSLYAGEMIGAWARRFLDLSPDIEILLHEADDRVTTRTGSGGFRTEMLVSGHPLVADEPETHGGSGQGPSPYDFLQAALGSCTTMTVQMYARRKQWPLEAAVVRLLHEKVHADDCVNCEERDRKIDRFERELDLIGPLSEEQRRRLLEIAEKCPVHRTLKGSSIIVTRLHGDKNEA
jgi:putative redox protein